jgi:hypothetical protein
MLVYEEHCKNIHKFFNTTTVRHSLQPRNPIRNYRDGLLSGEKLRMEYRISVYIETGYTMNCRKSSVMLHGVKFKKTAVTTSAKRLYL